VLYPLGYSWSMPSQPDLASVGDTDGFVSGEPMVNERSVRASAGLLFVLGFSALSVAFFTGDSQPLQGFAIVFLLEMGIRLGLDHRFSPSMILGALATRSQRPEWVSLEPKKWAWGLGFALALSTCLAVGWGNLEASVMMIACSVCLSLLFAESALGICVGVTSLPWCAGQSLRVAQEIPATTRRLHGVHFFLGMRQLSTTTKWRCAWPTGRGKTG